MSFLPTGKWLAFALVACVGALMNALAAAPSSATSCSATASTINFGNLAIGSLTGATTSGAVQEGCTGGWTNAGNLTGSAQTLTVYGQIPPQSPPPVGAYTDTVAAALWY